MWVSFWKGMADLDGLDVRPHQAGHEEGEGHWGKQGQQKALGLSWIAALVVRGLPQAWQGFWPRAVSRGRPEAEPPA